MGAEFKKKGVNVLLGPVVGPLGRVVSGGRNWEALSPDPYLSGVLVYESVDAIQGEGVITSTKVRVAAGPGPFAHDTVSLTVLRSISSGTSKRRIDNLTGMSRQCRLT